MDLEAQKFRAELAACRVRQEERNMRTVASGEDSGRFPSAASVRYSSMPPSQTACPWPPAQPQAVGRASRPQSARFVQETLTKLCDDNARCKLYGASPLTSVAPSRQLSAVELPPPPVQLGMEQPPRALLTVEMERWRDNFQLAARECIEELRGVMQEAGVAQFAGQLAEMRAADKAENAQLRDHLDELLRVNSSLRQVELEHLKGGPSLLHLCQQHFAEQQERWREDGQRWATHCSQLDTIVESARQQKVEQLAEFESADGRQRNLVEKMDRMQHTVGLQCEKVDTLLQKSSEHFEAFDKHPQDDERWKNLQTKIVDLTRAQEDRMQEVCNKIESKCKDNLEETRRTVEELLGKEASGQAQAKGLLDTVRAALGEALRETTGNAETRWQQIAALMENLDAQLRLNHQGIEHWRHEAQRCQADAEKAREESTRCREAAQLASDEAVRMGRELREFEGCARKNQQGGAADRGNAKSPKHAKARRIPKDRELQGNTQGQTEHDGHVQTGPAFGTMARREAPLANSSPR